MNIKKLCYELYCIDWFFLHSTVNDVKKAKREYYKNQTDYVNFDDYLYQIGIKGECPVCFDEFIDNEYRDKEYIKDLLCDNNLYREYIYDIISVSGFNLLDKDGQESRFIWVEGVCSVEEIQACIDKMKSEVEDYTIEDLKKYLPDNCSILNPKTVVW